LTIQADSHLNGLIIFIAPVVANFRRRMRHAVITPSRAPVSFLGGVSGMI
jgi:hypothetical protein